ncbi:MAG TPA: trypsin-like peptidase domain-containing protein [Streptosporangiaceae bacterium]|jgi:S1-C subfamily serine protease|nr:trypsin-like peptidase domain-containing protein [Streptosporangiaceae bacterium]
MQQDETGSEPLGGYGEWGGPPGGYGQPPRRRRRGRFIVYALVAVLAAGLGAGAGVGLNSGGRNSSPGISSGNVPGPRGNAPGGGSSALSQQSVAAKIEPGVVDINAAIQYSGGASSEGTGMVINTAGLVLTNNHVINGARLIRATLVTTGKTYTARVVGYDAAQDVALLQLQGASRLKAVTVGNSSQVTLGTPVLAIGNAGGRGGPPAVTSGIINSLDRTINPTDESTGATETLHGMLQTSAEIVSGDSGGPLANAAGQVIGMDTANASVSQGSSAVLGYAIPINRALSIARQITAGQGSPTIQVGVPGFLGVLVPQSTSANPRQQAQQQRQRGGGSSGSAGGQGARGQGCVSSDTETPAPSAIAPVSTGALVDGVLCGTAAATAGLASGDVITTVNGQAITTPGSLTMTMSKFRPGTQVRIGWVNTSGQQKAGTMTLGAAPAR